jgi:hypothetical protein
MKVIITENKLRDIQLNYLNTMRYDYAFYQSRYLGNIIMLNFPDDRYNYEMSEIMMEYDFEDFRLYIDSNFVKDFGFTYFPNQDDVQPFIRDWFEEKFGVKVKYVES